MDPARRAGESFSVQGFATLLHKEVDRKSVV